MIMEVQSNTSLFECTVCRKVFGRVEHRRRHEHSRTPRCGVPLLMLS